MNIKKLCLSSLLSISLLGLNESLIAVNEQYFDYYDNVDGNVGSAFQESSVEEDLEYYVDGGYAPNSDPIIFEDYYQNPAVNWQTYSEEVEAGDVEFAPVAESGEAGTVLSTTGSLADALVGIGCIFLVPLGCTAADIWYYDETSETNPELLCLTYAAAPYDGNATYCWNDGNVGSCS